MLLLKIWKNQPGRYFCISTKDRSGVWKDHFFTRRKFKEVVAFIEDNKDKDLYWCPHGFTRARRLKRYAEVPKLLWADLDEVSPRDIPEALLPSIAWESSPGRFAALWVLDQFMTEELNRALTYYLKADPGGWDLTQVLRIPNTTNYKYVSTPRVRMVWSDGPSYNAKDIEKALPREKKQKQTDRATGLYKKYEKNFSGYIRRQLLKGKPVKGKRSEVLWRLAHELIEAGCSRDEAFELLRVSPWNKFVKRRDGDEQLRRELDKALTQHFKVLDDESPGDVRFGEAEEEDEEEEYKYLSRSMADVEEEEMDWIWYPYLARGEVTILEGDPGLGKSYLAQMVSIGVTDGKSLPSVKKLKPVKGKVAYFDIENASGTVTKKRLITNGCKHLENFFQEEEPFTVDDEDATDAVYKAIHDLRPTLVVFDTVNTYIGSANTHKASETQQAFKRFIDIARRFNCSVMVIRHLTKSGKERALYRGQGSIAFTGLARVVMTVGRSPDDPETLAMAVTKINVTRAPKALTFTIQSLPDTLKQADRSKFVWGKFVDLTADDIVSVVTSDKKDNDKKDNNEEVKEFLTQILVDGEIDFKRIKQAAETRAISDRDLFRVANDMGIIKRSRGNRMFWSLPEIA